MRELSRETISRNLGSIFTTLQMQLLDDLFAAAKKSKRKRRMHVLCEKPLCTTVADCLRVRELVREAEKGDEGASPLFWVGMECKRHGAGFDNIRLGVPL